MEFAGFDDFIEIFRGGPQTDNLGRKHDGDLVIDQAAATFDPAEHEPPLVVGHPEMDAPAYGWVEELKAEVRDGVKVLLARFKEVVPEFADLVKAGRFKKRSASFWPDGRLRHVGFLGAAAPMVKGLADIKFGDDDDAETAVFEFGDDSWAWRSVAAILRRLREWVIERDGRDTADRIIPEFELEEVRSMPETTEAPEVGAFGEHIENPTQGGSDMDKEFTRAELEAAAAKAAEEAAAKARQEERDRQQAEFAEAQRASRRKAVAGWCDLMVEAGKLTPALVKGGVREVLEFMAGADDVVEFAEGGKKRPDEVLMGLIENEFPKLVEFGEIAGRDKNMPDAGTAGLKLDHLTRAKMKDRPDLTYDAAFAEAQAENPSLALEYTAELGINPAP